MLREKILVHLFPQVVNSPVLAVDIHDRAAIGLRGQGASRILEQALDQHVADLRHEAIHSGRAQRQRFIARIGAIPEKGVVQRACAVAAARDEREALLRFIARECTEHAHHSVVAVFKAAVRIDDLDVNGAFPVQSERIGVRLVLGVEVRVLPVHVRRIVRDRERGCVARGILFGKFRARNIDAVRCAEHIVRIGHKADDRKRRIMAFERLRAAADEEGRGRGIARLIALPERARPNDRIGRNRDGAAVDRAGLGRRRAVGRIAHGAALRHLDRNALRGGIYAAGVENSGLSAYPIMPPLFAAPGVGDA